MNGQRAAALARIVLALAAGGLHAVSVAAPWDGQARGWLEVAALALLVALLGRCATPPASPTNRPIRQGFGLGWAFALAWLAGSFWWLYISMHTYGGLPAPLAVLAVLALAAFLASYYAVASAVYVAWLARSPQATAPRRAIYFASAWTLAELARAGWFTGFPWAAGGYAHVDGLLAWLAPWIGVTGVGALAAAVAVLAIEWPRAPRPGRSAGLTLGALLVLGGIAAQLAHQGFTAPAGKASVALLQGNIPQDEKFVPGQGIEMSLNWYGEQLRVARTDLVVAPETALPVLPRQLPAGYEAGLRAAFRDGDRAALIGMPLGDATRGYTNSVVGWRGAGAPDYRYDKHHLVAFGEFVPPMFRWFTELMNIPLGDFERGGRTQPPLAWRGQRLAPHICYEDVFGDELGARFAMPGQEPTALVNVTNIGWFGDTVAVDQHLNIARMRALELERPMLRATNTGATVVIDHRGRVTHALPRFTRGVLLAHFEGRNGNTPYARWVSVTGHAPLWGLAGLPWVLAVAAWRRRAAPNAPGT